MTVSEALAELENDPRGVAETLKAAGIKGKKNNCIYCPVGVWLNLKCGYNISRWVRPFLVSFREPDAFTLKEIYLGQKTVKFILEFDSLGEYPELRLE